MKRKHTAKVAKWILIFNIVLVFGILGLFYVAINSSWMHHYAASVIKERTGWSIEVEKLRLHPLWGVVSLESAHVQDPTQRQLYQVGRLYVRFNPLSLVRGKIVVAKLEVNDAYLSFDKGPEKPDEGPPKFTITYISELSQKIANSFALQNIAVDEGQLDNIKILIQTRDGSYTDMLISHLDFSLHQSLWRRLNLVFSSSDFLINQSVVADKLEVDAVLSGDRVTFKKFYYARPEGTYEAVIDARTEEKAVTGDITISAEIPAAFQEKVHGEGKLRLVPPYLYLDPFTIQAGQLTLKPTARLQAKTGAYQIDLDMPATDLARVWAVFKLPMLEKLTGQAALKGQLKATLPAFGANAQLVSNEVIYDDQLKLTGLNADVNIKGRQATWDLKAPQLSSTGQVTLVPEDGLAIDQFVISAEKLPVEQVVLGDKVAGAVTGTLDIERKAKGYFGKGRFTQEEGRWGTTEIEAATLGFDWQGNTIDITEFSVKSPSFPEFAFTGPLRLTLTENEIAFTGQPVNGLDLKARYLQNARQVTLDSLQYAKSGETLHIDGFYRLDEDFRLHMKGAFDASLLGSLRQVFNEASGAMDVDLTGSGSIKQPQLTGYIQARRVNMSLRGLSDSISDFNGKLSINQNNVTLENFQGNLGDGSFVVTGKLVLQDFIPYTYDVRLKGDTLGYRIPATLQVDFDADLSIAGSMPSPLVSGKIDLISGRYYKNFNIAKKVLEERQIQVIKEKKTDYFDQWRWDLKIRNSGDLNIENNMADVFLAGDLRLKGTTQHPILEGVVTTTEGELFYLGQKMEIVEGTLEFQDPNRINPLIDFEASKEISAQGSRGLRSAYTVSVHVEGPLDNLQVKLSSTPSVDQTDIVSLLAFGMTQSDLREQGSSGSALASTAIASSLASGFGHSLGGTLGFDTLRFESGEGSDQAISGVAVGKDLSDRLTIEFYTDIAPEDAQRRIRGRYFLTDNIFLEGTNTVGGDQTIFDLNASLRFKIR